MMKHVALLFTLILSVSGFVYESGWRYLTANTDTSVRPSEYLDFNPYDTRLQMRLTQLLPYEDDMEFGLVYEFFEEERRTTYVSSVNFQWSTQTGHRSSAYLHIGEDFTDCLEGNPEMLDIPQSLSIDLNTEHTVELNGGRTRGTFKNGCEEGSSSWNLWKQGMERIRKIRVRVIDERMVAKGVRLDDYFELEYRLVKACPVGSSLSDRTGLCDICQEDHFSEGGYVSACSRCPQGSTVPQGAGFGENNCTFWNACPEGHYKDHLERCIQCSPGHHSEGGDALFCRPCPKDSYSGVGARVCEKCPEGTGVEAGEGLSEDDCSKDKAAGAMAVYRPGTYISLFFVAAYCLLQ